MSEEHVTLLVVNRQKFHYAVETTPQKARLLKWAARARGMNAVILSSWILCGSVASLQSTLRKSRPGRAGR